MSGIYNQPSIYKQGGGGGGFKDGGALVDGDFIAVSNNTISTYDNESRDPVNFYFDVKPGEVINSVIEFTTQVNATINVYVVNSYGELVPIGNIGGNTVTAGESYNITVVGNSFMLENVVEPITPDEPSAIIIDGTMYGCKKVGNRIWATSNLGIITPNSINNGLGLSGNRLYPSADLDLIQNTYLSGGWRIANSTDWADLRDNSGYTVQELQSTDYWASGWAGNNNSGLDFKPIGYKQNSTQTFYYKEKEWAAQWSYPGTNRIFYIGVFNNNRVKQFTGGQAAQIAPIRICKTA